MEVSDFTTGDRGRKDFLKVVNDSMNKLCGGVHTYMWGGAHIHVCGVQWLTLGVILNRAPPYLSGIYLFVCLFIIFAFLLYSWIWFTSVLLRYLYLCS